MSRERPRRSRFRKIPPVPVQEGIDAQVISGQALAITGPNGAGKSTFALTLGGLLAPVAGTVGAEPRAHYALSNAGPEVAPEGLARVRFTRHRIEEVFGAAKQETGLARDEVRGWVGWHHHRTLSLLALWFLCCW